MIDHREVPLLAPGAEIRDDLPNKHAQAPPFHWTCLQLQGNSEGHKIQINYCYRHFKQYRYVGLANLSFFHTW